MDLGLDAGETAAILIAESLHADQLLIDERIGRKVAEGRRIVVRGTIGVLVQARQANVLAALKPVIEALLTEGFRIAPTLVHEALESMPTTISDVFSHDGQKGTHDYDFGSTTRLSLARTGIRVGRFDKSGVRLLGRNDPLRWTCGVCSQPATLVCCAHESDSSPFVCAAHRKGHRRPEVAFLPVVNSPRMGICAYGGRVGALAAYNT